MKKIKIMLLSMAVLATIGGALAFNSRFSTTYCILTAVEVPAGTYTYTAGLPCIELINIRTTFSSDPYANPIFYGIKSIAVPEITCGDPLVTCTTFRFIKSNTH